jgi:hypothetical protein
MPTGDEEMPKKTDLMGLGMPYQLAARMATEPLIATAAGGTRASATVIGGTQYLVCFNNSNSGAGAVLPAIGGDVGCLMGDDFIVNNQIVGGMTVYAPAGMAISMAGALASGSGGVALSSHTSSTFYPVSASTWIGVVGS